MAEEQKRSVKERVIEESRTFAEIVGYLWVVISLFHIHELAILRTHHLEHSVSFTLGLNLINAIVLGKIVLIGYKLHIAERFTDTPLIYSILFRSAVFAVMLICFEIVEKVVIGEVRGMTVAQSIPQMGGGGLEGKALAGIVVFIVLIPLFAFTELRRVLGRAEIHSLLFENRAKAGAARGATR